MLRSEKWRRKYFDHPSAPDWEWYVRQHKAIKAKGGKGDPAVLERPLPEMWLEGLIQGFYTLQSSGDYSITGMDRLYDLIGVFDRVAWFEIMLDTHSALENERYKQSLKNG